MKMRIKSLSSGCVTILMLFFVSSSCANSSVHIWKIYSIDDTLTLQYPSSLLTVETTPGRLTLKSTKGGPEGVGIGEGQAEIIISVHVIDPHKTLNQIIKYNIRNQQLISERDLKIRESDRKNGCSHIREVTSRDEVGPNAFMIDTGLFCETNNQKRVTILLLTWEDDPITIKYKTIVEDIAMSIKEKSNE